METPDKMNEKSKMLTAEEWLHKIRTERNTDWGVTEYCAAYANYVKSFVPDDAKEAKSLVIRLAEWSKKYPRGRIYSASNMDMDKELIQMEEDAKKFCELHKEPKI